MLSYCCLMRSMLWTRARSSTGLTGLLRKSSAPAAMHWPRSSLLDKAVTMTMGMDCQAGTALMRRQVSVPLIPGIITSSKIRSGATAASVSMASWPLRA